MISESLQAALKFEVTANGVSQKVWDQDQGNNLLHEVARFVQVCQSIDHDEEDNAFDAEVVSIQSENQSEEDTANKAVITLIIATMNGEKAAEKFLSYLLESVGIKNYVIKLIE